MKKYSIVVLCFVSVLVTAQKIKKVNTDKEKLSYSIGANIAQNLKQQDMGGEIDLDVIKQAMSDVLADKELIFPQDSINNFMQSYIAKKGQEIEKKKIEQAEVNKAEGIRFLEKNKNKEGVLTTDSGLQYEVLTQGGSVEKPKGEDMVKVKYTGKLLDGKIFDSTDKNNKGEAIEFPLNRVIKGWTEGVGLMTKGSKYRFYIPSELAYGEGGTGRDIGPNSTLIFDVELIDFTPMESELAPSPAE